MLLTLVPDLSVAPLKYAHVHRDHGGPIASISFRERESEGLKFFEAFAHLDEAKTGYSVKGKFLYGDSHGTGTAKTKPDAIYAAVSEALERWAWDSCSRDTALRAALRYDLDPSTTGFAAFPGLGTQGARKRAYFEAAERWSLAAWWEGKLGHKPLAVSGAEGVQLITPTPACSVVVLWKMHKGLVCYGFASSYSAAAAAEKARVELLRNQDILEFYSQQSSLPPLNLTERRLRFFAEAAGFGRFQQRLDRQGAGAGAPTLVVDRVVIGPWSQYAHVWRCLFDGGAVRENDGDDYFLF
ncbi:MAG: hypothetical protein ACXVB9_08600 [Bdellovibrionota bacterium]